MELADIRSDEGRARWRCLFTVGRFRAIRRSSIAPATGLQCASQPQQPPPPTQVTYYRTNFSDGTTGPLDVYAYGGGSCIQSTDYTDPGSAYSMKCTVPAGTGAAALQAWFGQGRLSGLPKDPSLDHDLFEEVRFVLGPGAAGAVDPNVLPALIAVLAHAGDAARYDEFLKRFRSASTRTTRRPSSVKRRAPMWPGIRFPLMMRDGSVPGAIEPGLRCRVLPCVSGPPAK